MADQLGHLIYALQRRQGIQSKDNNVGSARDDGSDTKEDTSNSLSSFLCTLVPILLFAGVLTLLFLILRSRLKRNYQPRTYLGSLRPQERTPEVPGGFFKWIINVSKIPDSYVLNHHSLDAFLLLRYLKISASIFFVGCIITWPVLFPVNITSSGYQKQLNMLSIANVTDQDKNRLYAHVFIAMIFYAFFFYTVAREIIFYINLRQAYLLSPVCANRISSRTVLFTSVPDDYLNEAKLRRVFGNAVKNIWIANECDEIEKLVEERDKVAFKLEGAETKLIKLAAKARAKAIKKGRANDDEPLGDANGESGSVAARWVQPKQRPTHRLKFLIGKKVDTINWCRSELERLVPQIDALQAKYRAGEATFVCSVFIEFYTQTEAQAAFQSLAHHQALHMAPRYIGVNPEQVIWENLKVNWASRVVRNIVTIGFVVLLIIFWSIPVGVVGSISNIRSLTDKVPFLGFILDIPPIILGVVQGLLPVVLLAVLMALLPIILRFMAKKGGCPTRGAIELRTQNFYFLFQVVQVFLITTFTSAASAVASKIVKQPTQAPQLLASNLPHASNFFISYLILQGLTVSANALAQIAGVILFRILGKILDTTPRKLYKRFSTLSGLGWGTVFPIYTNLTVIALSYAVMSPLILGFATIGMYLLYLAYRYNLLFVLNADVDTQGLIYPRALQQTTTGAYISMVCLIGLFAVNKAIGPAILMLAFLILVILFHVTLNSAVGPLIKYLPKSLQAEEQSLLALEDGRNHGDNTTTPFTSAGDDPSGAGKAVTLAPHKKPNAIVKWLKPHVYTDYQTLRRLVASDYEEAVYDAVTERDAYYNPAISSPTPLLWIPRDPMGISRQECAHSSKVIPMTDEGAFLDEKNNIGWDQESGRPPIYKEKIYY